MKQTSQARPEGIGELLWKFGTEKEKKVAMATKETKMEKTREAIRIVKFNHASRAASTKLDGVIDEYYMVVDDWQDREYGMLIFATVPKEYLSKVRSELGNIPGVTYSE